MKKIAFIISLLASLPVFFFFTLLLFFFDKSWFFLPLCLMMILTILIVYGIKWWFPTKRPVQKKLTIKKTLFTHWMYVNQSSFPSAHTALAVGLTTILAFFSWKLFFVGLAFSSLIAWSRVYLQKHYPKDLIGGAIVGILTGIAAWYLAPHVSFLF